MAAVELSHQGFKKLQINISWKILTRLSSYLFNRLIKISMAAIFHFLKVIFQGSSHKYNLVANLLNGKCAVIKRSWAENEFLLQTLSAGVKKSLFGVKMRASASIRLGCSLSSPLWLISLRGAAIQPKLHSPLTTLAFYIPREGHTRLASACW